MIDSLLSQIGFAVALLVAGFAFLKGDEPERIGAGAYVLGMFSSVLLQGHGARYGSELSLTAIDSVFLVICAWLAWKSRRAWPLWACAFQAVAVMSHILTLVDPGPPLAAFYVVLNIATYGVLTALAVGVFLAWQDRRAAGLE